LSFNNLFFVPIRLTILERSEAEKSCDFSRFFLNALHHIPAVACGKDFSTPLTLWSK
jgi:hypothetical protein